MRDSGEIQYGMTFPQPGPALKGVLILLFVVWLGFALTINWGPDDVASSASDVLDVLVGNTDAVYVGQLWRLLTAAVVHSPVGLGHLVFTLLGLYFLSPALEASWGSGRFLRFLVTAALVAYGFQALVLMLLPDFAVRRLAGPEWYGAFPIVEAIAIAWAMSFKGRRVLLFMVLPVTSTQLILFVVAGSVLAIVALQASESGLIAPIGGMLAGWLFSGTVPTYRRLYLKLRLRQHERALSRLDQARRARVASSGLRVIEGGRGSASDSTPPSDPSPPSGPGGRLLH